jgi:hypothetical protein
MDAPQLFVTELCNISSLLHVSVILPFWVQFGRVGAATTRDFKGITSCKVAVMLYIILCQIKFDVVTPELVVHYNAMLTDILFNKLFINSSYNYFLIGTIPPTGENSVLITNNNLRDIIRHCNILPMGLYDTESRSMEHYFLIVKFSEDDYRIISAYGGVEIYVELTESRIELTQLVEFVNNVNTRNIDTIRQFIITYFLTGNLTKEQINKEIMSYRNSLQLFYFHNLVGQIKQFVSSYPFTASGGYKKRNHRASLIHRRRNYSKRITTKRRRITTKRAHTRHRR